MNIQKNKNIYVTQPSMPDLNQYVDLLKQIWNNKHITNNGLFHKKFEQELCNYLEIDNISLLANGTIALIVALQALQISGEVITTPYSFVATTHALHWNGITPVFCDINKETFNIDPEKIEPLITSETSAILPVHVYGNPADNEKIQKIADKYNLKVIYDAAHAFGVKKDNKSILNWGDLSILSFHATKSFNTVEGGAIITKDKNLKAHIDNLKNFGFINETTVVGYGINGKMNELIAAYGLLQLKQIDSIIKKRKEKTVLYRKLLKNTTGIKIFDDNPDITYNYSYFPVLITKDYHKSRDNVYNDLRKKNIYARRYFYPLISNFPAYKNLPSAKKEKLPTANKISNEILCLPVFSELSNNDIIKITEIIKQ